MRDTASRPTIRFRPPRVSLLLLAALCAPSAKGEPAAAPDRASREVELRGVETNLKASDEERRRIQTDVEALKLDSVRLNEALVDTTAKIRGLETERAEATEALGKAAGDSRTLESSLAERRGRIGELIAALQRMTHDAPPAILVRPDDMAAAVRAASVVDGLVVDAQTETKALASDLTKASDLKTSIAAKRDELASSAESLAVERTRLASLVDARQRALEDREGALAAERKRADDLAGRATSLKDLIARMDGQAASASAADRAAAALVERSAATPGGDSARLSPSHPFSEDKGLLAMPVVGKIVKAFGDSDGAGGQTKGVSIAVAPGALVSTPVDAWVAFAGPYRSYGQLLILNAGEGYYLVLAGMEQIQVAVGQFILAGEPVAVMGSGTARTAAAAGAIGADQPVLYIELRKNDSIVDPQPWWVKLNLEKAHG